MARDFKELEVWRLSYNLVLDIYKIINKLPEYEKDNLTLQIRRAVVSIPINIAEGCSRFSKKAFLQFLSYSYGSLKELYVLIMLCKDLKYINVEEYKILYEKLDKLSRKLFVFMTSVEKENWFDWFNKKKKIAKTI